MSNRRLDFIDLAKCFGIFTMVWCHGMVTQNVDIWVHGFHMPLFFLLSGWCFSVKRNPRLLPFLKSRVSSLIIPYVFWSVVLYAGWQLFYLVTDPTKTVPLKTLCYSLFYNNAMVSPYCAVQWFLTCMFFTQLLGWGILKLTKEKPLPTAFWCVGLGLAGWLMGYLPFRLPLSLDVAFSATCFLLIGWLLGQIKNQKRLLHPLMGVVGVGLGSWLIFVNGYVNMRVISFANPLLFYIAATIFTLGVLSLCRLVCHQPWCKPLLWIGKNTLAILMLNQVFMQTLKLLVPTTNPWVWFVLALTAILAMVPFILLCNRLLPFSVGRKKANVTSPYYGK